MNYWKITDICMWVFYPLSMSVSYSVLLGASHHARPTAQWPVELTKGKWNGIVWEKQISNRNEAFHLRLDQNCLYFSAKWDRKRSVRPDWTDRPISTRTEAFRLCFDQNFRKFSIMESAHWVQQEYIITSQKFLNFLVTSSLYHISSCGCC